MPRLVLGPLRMAGADATLQECLDPHMVVIWGDDASNTPPLQDLTRWNDVKSNLPSGFVPECVVCIISDSAPPLWTWESPLPLVAIVASDAYRRWHAIRSYLARFDGVFGDHRYVANLQALGIPIVEEIRWCGGSRVELIKTEPRDIDLLWIGGVDPDWDRDQLPLLARLARLRERWNVVFHPDTSPDSVRPLLSRAKVVLVAATWEDSPKLMSQATACGALAIDTTMGARALNGESSVNGNADPNECLIAKVVKVIENNEWQAVGGVPSHVVQLPTWDTTCKQLLERIDRKWDELQRSAEQRHARVRPWTWNVRVWHNHESVRRQDSLLVRDLSAAAAEPRADAHLHYLLSVAIADIAKREKKLNDATLSTLLEHCSRAVDEDSRHALAMLGAVRLRSLLGEKAQAILDARRGLAILDEITVLPDQLLHSPLPLGGESMLADWECATWQHPTDRLAEASEKRRLLRGRFHQLLAELTSELHHYYEAAMARPELSSAQAALGCALGRQGHPHLAIGHLRRAVQRDILDRDAARALFVASGEVGDAVGQRRIRRDYWLLHQSTAGLVPVEDWFANAPPAGDELASILVVCHDRSEKTRLCLESIVRCTHSDYELIIVDNGSTEETVAYLQQFKVEVTAGSPQRRLELIRNESNRGALPAFNQALALSRGRYVAMLHNDTIVSDGWLQCLIDWSLHDWPKIGLVGPVTSIAGGSQAIGVHFGDLDGIGRFAQQRSKAFSGQAASIGRLDGFCILARREVIDQIGLLDESYSGGPFGNHDFCLRAEKAGFEALIALGVYVHHFGNPESAKANMDRGSNYQENLARFEEAWGPQQRVHSRPTDPTEGGLPEPPIVPSWPAASIFVASHTPTTRPKVSLCMIVRNEEHNLPECLASIADLVDEMIVVDTGSNDRTREIAERAGAKVFDLPWPDSFAVARNESLRHAQGEWVFWLDADDRIDAENRERLRALFESLADENIGYVMKCLCLPDLATGTATVVDHVRLFRNDPRIRWRYRVHEQILMSIRESSGRTIWSDVVIHHIGYQDPERRGPKLERDLRLLQLENADNPDDPFTLFNLGWTYNEAGCHTEALPLLQRSLAKSQPEDSIVRKLYALLLQCHLRLGQVIEALQVCREGRRLFRDDAELLFEEGNLLLKQDQFAAAEACFVQLLAQKSNSHFASVDAGLRGYKAQHYLGVLCQMQNRTDEAVEHFSKVLMERPAHLPALLGLAETRLERREWTQLNDVCQRLLEMPGGRMEAEILQARAYLAQGQFTDALRQVDATSRDFPQAMAPRLVRSHVLLQEGRDLAAAEEALNDVLRLDPENAQAKRNLTLLQQERQAEPRIEK